MSAALPSRPRHASRGRTASRRLFCAAVVLFTSVLSALPPAMAQTSSGTVSGTVHDESGAAVPDAAITVTNPATALERKATTDRAGTFSVPFIPPGRYIVSAARDGFSTTELRDVVINVNDQASLAITLKVRGSQETVTVIAEASRASVAAGTGTVVDRQFIANIPLNGNSLQALLQLVPGVVITPNSGGPTNGAQFSVSGQRTTANYFQVDGVSANTGLSVGINTGGTLSGITGTGQSAGTNALGGTSSLASLDAIQEFRVETSNFAPEYGRTPGGQIMLVTRGGTNAFHGSATEFFRHDAMNANDWFTNNLGLPKPKMRQHLFSGVLGGPIRSNRAFFFGSYETLRLEQPRTKVINVPTVAFRALVPAAVKPLLDALPIPNLPDVSATAGRYAAGYSEPSNASSTALRVDGTLTNALTAFVRMSHAPSEATTRISSLTTITHSKGDADFVTAGGTWVIGSRLTLDGRANWTRNTITTESTFDPLGGAIKPDTTSVFPSGRNPGSALGALSLPSGGYIFGRESGDVQRQWNAVGTLAWVLGSHQFKFGADYRRLTPSLVRGLQETVFFSSDADVLTGRAFYILNNADAVAREPILTNLSLYAQDVWRMTRRLTATYGFRFERVPPPTDAAGNGPRTLTGLNDGGVSASLAPEGTALWKGRTGAFAPRVGLAYQLLTRSRWEATIRGGGGVFHDLGLSSVANAFRDGFPYIASKVVAVTLPIASADAVPPVLGKDPPSLFYAFDPNLRMPYTYQWHASWEQAIGSSQNVTVSYVGARGRDLLLQQLDRRTVSDWPQRSPLLLINRNLGRSSYESAQFQYLRRLHQGLQVLAAYTLSSSRDNGTSDQSAYPISSAGAIVASTWAPSDYDARHVLSLGLTYEVASSPRAGWAGHLLRGWGVDAMFRAQSGFPLTPIGGPSIAGVPGISQRADVVPGQPLYLSDSSVPGGRRVNPAAFAVPPTQDRQGTAPRNLLRAFGVSQLDLAVRREVLRMNNVRCQLKVETFNLLNRPSFGPFETSVAGALFGQATQSLNQALGGLNALYQLGGARSIQLSVRATF